LALLPEKQRPAFIFGTCQRSDAFPRTISGKSSFSGLLSGIVGETWFGGM
jgi:hypothetical protein